MPSIIPQLMPVPQEDTLFLHVYFLYLPSTFLLPSITGSQSQMTESVARMTFPPLKATDAWLSLCDGAPACSLRFSTSRGSNQERRGKSCVLAHIFLSVPSGQAQCQTPDRRGAHTSGAAGQAGESKQRTLHREGLLAWRCLPGVGAGAGPASCAGPFAPLSLLPPPANGSVVPTCRDHMGIPQETFAKYLVHSWSPPVSHLGILLSDRFPFQRCL